MAMFTGGQPKEMLTTAVSDMAKAMTPAYNFPSPIATTNQTSNQATTGISPGKIASLRTNYLQQMRDIHSLYENGALNEVEFSEQKAVILQQLNFVLHDHDHIT